jgi:amino acid adenylation domain-containing protein
LPFTSDAIEGSVPDRFAKIAATRPSALAVAAGNERLTYRELDGRSDGLAAAIVRATSGSGAPVALLLTDPVWIVTGMLATWKAGKFCVPLDSALPPSRLEGILHDSEAGLVVTDRDTGAILSPARDLGQLRIDEFDLLDPAEPPRVNVRPESLACLLYTSGSTGEPKGVMQSHRNLLHRARSSIAALGVQPADRISALHSPSFFAGLRDVLTALLGGAALLPFDPRRAGLRALAEWIDREQISVLCAVVTPFRHLLAGLAPHKCFQSVRAVRLGSEPLFRQDVERFRQHFRSDCLLLAGYGASEVGGIAKYRMHHDTPLPAGRVPAGYALEGAEILVLDDDRRPVPPGVAGEVAVRSRYLSDGYWRRPDLTRATFLTDPADPNIRMYRTGDIGRLGPDGCLELIGRKDQQVKVRGYRVHPGEIELALAEHPAIREAVVIARAETDGEPRLVAYVVPNGPAPHAGALRQFLAPRIPAYMMPSVFISLEALPVTANGKVDRAALPPPPKPAAARGAAFVPPQSPLEHQIAAIWEELFGLSPIGAGDNFFDLGGDSLLAAALVAAIEEVCGRALPPAVLLEAATVAGLAARIALEDSGFTEPLTALRASGVRAPLFFVHNDNGRGVYTYALARCLDADRPLYAVHLHGLAGPALPPTVEAIAADRLRAVRAARPRGPYVLGGHCYGGLIALEMARQLQAEGERVEAVVMVDTPAPGFGLRALHGASRMLGRLRGLSPAERDRLFMRIDQSCERLVSRVHYYQGRFRVFRGLSGGAQAEFVTRKLVTAARGAARALPSRRTPREGGPAHDSPVPLVQSWEAFRRAIRCYRPRPYAGRVALFRTEQWPADRPDLGWSRLLPLLEVAVIPGDHHTCITRHVAAFAASVEEALQRAETASSANPSARLPDRRISPK